MFFKLREMRIKKKNEDGGVGGEKKISISKENKLKKVPLQESSC